MDVSEAKASPAKAVCEELDALRESLRATTESYAVRIEAEIDAVRVLVATLLDREKLSGAQLKDLRDILAELRGLQVKAEKGRRKDLKKIEILVGDLLLITEKW